ncbi:hypothetical protein FKM82_014636 [Ascaphus truei]
MDHFLKTPQECWGNESGQSGKTVYVGNLPNTATQDQIEYIFAKYEFKDVRVVHKGIKCYAFVTFEDSDMIQLVIRQMNNSTYESRRLIVRVSYETSKSSSHSTSQESEYDVEDCKNETDGQSLSSNDASCGYEEVQLSYCNQCNQHTLDKEEVTSTDILKLQSCNLKLEKKKLELEIFKLQLEIQKLNKQG